MFIPHAGGSASAFQHWCNSLDPRLNAFGIQYPGRGPRISEPTLASIDEIVRPISRFLETIEGPLVVVGHSLGAVIGFDVLSNRSATLPNVRAFVASSAREPFAEPIFGGPDYVPSGEPLIRLMMSWGGLPKEITDNPDLADVLLSPVSSDLKLLEQRLVDASQSMSPRAKIDCPLLVFYGELDPIVSSQDANGWASACTSDEVTISCLAGGHFHSDDDVRNIAVTINGLFASE